MDWSLWACARAGHVTYSPTEDDLRARLHVQTSAGEAWRCLRCWDFVLAPPAGSGPAEQAPTVRRGPALREAFVLRLLAAERFLRALLLGLLAYAVVRFSTAQTSLLDLFDKVLPRARPLAAVFNYDLDTSPTVARVQHLLNARSGTLHVVAALLVGYAAIEVVEGVGLWSLQRWGEYVAVVATSVFLPVEIYELTRDVTALKVVAFAVNVALVAYLVIAKRLFGVRGGARAATAARHSESLLQAEQAALAAGPRSRGDHPSEPPR